MPASYGNPAGFYVKFPKETSVSSTDVLTYLEEASEWLESSLASKYAVPFSGNATATRLTYQKTYHLLKLRTLDPDDSDEMGTELQAEIERLLKGEKVMMTNSSQAIQPVDRQVAPEEEAFSTSLSYTPVFGLDEAAAQEVDPDLINDRRNDRGS